jgi:hypothetical protein
MRRMRQLTIAAGGLLVLWVGLAPSAQAAGVTTAAINAHESFMGYELDYRAAASRVDTGGATTTLAGTCNVVEANDKHAEHIRPVCSFRDLATGTDTELRTGAFTTPGGTASGTASLPSAHTVLLCMHAEVRLDGGTYVDAAETCASFT